MTRLLLLPLAALIAYVVARAILLVLTPLGLSGCIADLSGAPPDWMAILLGIGLVAVVFAIGRARG